MTRARGWLVGWQPQKATLQLIGHVEAVLAEYREHLPLTLRQVFYRLVGTVDFPKDEHAYKRLCEMVGRARRARLIPMRAIRDDGSTRVDPPGYGSTAELVELWQRSARTFRLDRQFGQPVRLFIWCEAGGMVPQLARVANPFGVSVISSGGFDSFTLKHELAAELARLGDVEVLHLGDHDPSGVHVFSSLAEDIGAFVEAAGGSVRFTRIVVTPDQIELHNLPTAPPKPTDNRSFSGLTTQAEALPPDVLAGIVEAALIERTDAPTRERILRLERLERAELLKTLDQLRP